ncbi:hypothetical protein X736_31050 [Mesorhizobium sp. L2C089B000]|nr:hypothetical protein X736_31050 [Mesorhizobium sp. L2C089B000]
MSERICARTALYEAAHSLLVLSKNWSRLSAWGMNVAKRRGMARARVAVAACSLAFCMWSGATEFRFGRAHGRVSAKWRKRQTRSNWFIGFARNGVIRIVPLGTTGKVISLAGTILRELS